MTPVSHGKPCAGNPHARFDEGASAPEKPRRNALLHKTLTWKPILSNLEEANGELRRLHWQLHYLTFGELPSDCPRRHDSSYMAWIARDLERNPLGEGRLFVCMEHAFHHINWAWNCRHTSED